MVKGCDGRQSFAVIASAMRLRLRNVAPLVGLILIRIYRLTLLCGGDDSPCADAPDSKSGDPNRGRVGSIPISGTKKPKRLQAPRPGAFGVFRS